MSVVCKLFIQSAHQNPDGRFWYELSAVCRGEENKAWAAATPSGQLKPAIDPVLDEVWDAKVKSFGALSAEVLVSVIEDADGPFAFESCEFAYGGCAVRFRQKDGPYTTLSMTINASAATLYMREAYARSLVDGKPAKFRIEIRPA